MENFNKKVSLALLVSLVITLFVPIMGFANETTVNLGTADSFAVLAGSTITNTGTTTINGDIGLDPGTDFTGQETLTVIDGEIYIDDDVALQAKNDLQTAYTDAAGRDSNTIGAELGGSTLTPGVYSSATSFGITGTLTLDGQNNSDAVFILQAGTTLDTATNSNVELINGASAKNVFWQVGSSATLGANSVFAGSILASESITATTGAEIEGQLLALNGAVTLDSNTITTYTPGSLTVEKTVDGDIGDMTLPVFEITVTGPENFSSTRTFVNNETYTWENLVSGEYNVTESRTELSSEWTVSGEGTVQLVAGESHLVTITNSYIEITENSDTNETDTNETDTNETDTNETDTDETDTNETDTDETDTNESDTNESDINEAIPETGQKIDYSMTILFGSLAAIMASVGILLGNKKNKLNE